MKKYNDTEEQGTRKEIKVQWARKNRSHTDLTIARAYRPPGAKGCGCSYSIRYQHFRDCIGISNFILHILIQQAWNSPLDAFSCVCFT